MKAETVRDLLPKRSAGSHKGDHGHVLVLAGSAGMAGALIFACKGALRCGAGLVSAGVLREVYPILASSVPEAIGICLENNREGCFEEKHISFLQSKTEFKTSLVIGPGIPVNPITRDFFMGLSELNLPASQIWDAGALSLLAFDNGLWKNVPENCVFTPHAGEMSKLTGLSIEEIQRNRTETALRFAREKKVILLLKGQNTVIAAPDGRYFVNPTGHPAMAAAGMGDVLSGVIGAFLGQGLSPFEAAFSGAYIHGLAGELAVDALGSDRGLLASDVTEFLPKAIEKVKTC